MWVPLMISLGFFDMEKPNTAPGAVFEKLAFAEFLKMRIQRVDLICERSISVFHSQGYKPGLLDLDEPLFTFSRNPGLAGARTDWAPSEAAVKSPDPDLTGIFMPAKKCTGPTFFNSAGKIFIIEVIYNTIQELSG